MAALVHDAPSDGYMIPRMEGGFDRAAMARRLRQARDAKRLSRVQLADQLGVHHNTIVKWEDPDQQALPLDKSSMDVSLNTYADILDVSVGWLLLGEQQPASNDEVLQELHEVRLLLAALLAAQRRERT